MSLLAERDTAPSGLRVEALGERDRAELLALIDRDPYVNVVADVRVRSSRALTPEVCGTLLGARDGDGALRGAVLDAGNLLPIGGGPPEWSALGARLASGTRGCSSIVGRADAVRALWHELAPAWGARRAFRAAQPLLLLHRDDRPAEGDPRVRAMRMLDLDAYLPAAAAMFADELGVDPLEGAGRADYRKRVAGLIAAGRSFGIIENGDVVFKADLGATSARTCQVQGVWVRPDLRGQGVATSAMAQVLLHALELAPTVSLYVNDFNEAARRLYARLRMTEVATLSTVLF